MSMKEVILALLKRCFQVVMPSVKTNMKLFWNTPLMSIKIRIRLREWGMHVVQTQNIGSKRLFPTAQSVNKINVKVLM